MGCLQNLSISHSQGLSQSMGGRNKAKAESVTLPHKLNLRKPELGGKKTEVEVEGSDRHMCTCLPCSWPAVRRKGDVVAGKPQAEGV